MTMPLTGAQAGIWFAQRLDPGNPLYNAADRLDIHGPLDAARFERALRRCLAEAEPLRLRFTEEPAQYVPDWDSVSGRLVLLDLRGEADPEASAEAWMRAGTRVPVDVVTGTLHHHALLRLSDEHTVWYLRAHHILIDAYALSLLVGRVADIYAALTDALSPGPSPFGTLAPVLAEERDYRRSRQFAADRAYWLKQLAGRPDPVGLTREPPAPAHELVRCRAVLPPARHWDALARQARATWADVAAAGVACYVGRVTGTADVVIGLPLMNRSGAGVRVPCLAANVLPLRLDVRQGRTLGALVEQAARRIAEARAHGRYRSEDLRRDLGLAGTRHPLFGPMLNIKPFPTEVKFAGSTATVTNLAAGPVDDVAVTLSFAGDRLVLDLDGNAARYTPESLGAHTRRLANFLTTLAAMPADTPLGRLDLLTDEDRAALPAPRRPPVAPQPVVAAFQQQVRLAPHDVALVTRDEKLTFAELGARVDHMAGQLMLEGAGPGAIVALALPRSAELVVALLAVLRCGAAFLPVDPGYPAERRRLMLTDAAPSIVITPGWAQGGAAPRTRMTAPHPGDAAYVIYTSGSTGKPKGVVATHGGLAALLAGHRERLIPGGGRLRVAHTTSFSFDAALDPLLWMVLGHELHLLGEDVHADGAALTAYVREHAIDCLDMTPSQLKELPELLDDPPPITVVGGEAVPEPLWSALRERTRAVNHYGPTEATVDAYTWSGDGREWPTDGTGVHVLDLALRPAPPGVVGELYLSGAGLARGYLNRPALTAERFVAAPGGERLYRTGDLARWHAGGHLELLGRGDEQLKLRGLRIEPGEIEAVLESHPDVGAAAVAVHGDRLIGYVTPAADPQLVRKHAAEHLPAALTPAAIVPLATLPRTPGGKLERAALPPPPAGGRDTEPCSAAERALCELFTELLGVSAGPRDSFFDLGGHSLLAGRLAARIRESFGVRLPVRAIFSGPTPAELAARLPADRAARPPLRRRRRPQPMPLSSAQSRLWFLNRADGRGPAGNLPIAVRLSGPMDREAMATALADVVARHEILRTVFPDRDGVPYQEVRAPAPVTLPLWQPDMPEAAMRTIARRAFDLTREPPFRAHLLRLGAREHILMLVLHHIAGDAWSVEPLVRDVQTAYAARAAGHCPGFDPLPVQYADYTLWQLDLGEPGREHWIKALAGLPGQLTLPVDRPRPAVPSGAGGTVPVAIPPEIWTGALDLARRSHATPFMVLHAALAALLTRLGAGTDLPIGTTVAGRHDSALAGAVGSFANLLVLRADTSGDPAFAELLRRVREADLAAFDHPELPFDRLVEALNPARSRDRHPLFQVMLVLREAAEVRLVHTGTAKFDLTLQLDTDGNGFLEYSTDLFDRDNARSIATRFTRLLGQAVTEPELPIGRLDLLDAAERAWLTGGADPDAVPVPGETIPDRFEAQARRSPQAKAVGALTFRTLNTRANQLAHKLIAHGARPEAVVAVDLPPGADLVVAILAVLKAGAACLPLEPSDSRQRADAVLADAGPVCVVDESWLRDLGDWLGHNPERRLRPGHPAYATYSSGTAGLLVTHRDVLRLLTDAGASSGFSRRDVWASSGLSPREVWGALLSGARLVIVPHSAARSPLQLLALLRREKVTVLNLTPAAFDRLVADDDGRELPLRYVILDGAVPDAARVRDWRPDGPRTIAVRAVTETTVHVVETSAHGTGRARDAGRDPRVYVLDEHLQPVPPGVPGEVYAPVPALARGYLGRPGLTAERLPADPFGPPGARMYRTGDLAAWRRDGNLVRTGRRAPGRAGAAARPPYGPRVETLCELFAEVLGLPRAGVDDGFFDLGGHSLAAVRLIDRIGQVLGAALPIGSLFAAQTPAALLSLVEAGTRADPLGVLLPLRSAGSRPPLFAVHPAGGLGWCYGGLIKHLPDRPIYALQARRHPLPATLADLAADYAAQIRSVQPDGPYHLLGWSAGGVIAQELAVLLADVQLLAILDAHPAESLRESPPPDEAEALEALLTMDGRAPEAALTLERVAEILRREGSPLAGLPTGTLAELRDVHLNTDLLMRGHDTRAYRGDALYFRATGGALHDRRTAGAWRPHITGAIDAHDVACDPRDLTRPGPLAHIGAVIAARGGWRSSSTKG
ncbi:amino acid adenylation domain-containing protein [Nonomuraea typhae]|uniref:Amino acid adenylation domain-containing protein n=1 Tax=Nonomuraea typhae TaxID=2603600 RepID=A0ABW7YN61_9ACTN